MRIDRHHAALLVVDVQDRLAAAMPEVDRLACERNIDVLVRAARRLGLPIVVTEQYPKGLGPTVASLASTLGLGEDSATRRLEKMTFACTDDDGFRATFRELGRKTWIVVGMETHVCVYQTARGLRELGAQVHVPADAVVSRTAANRSIGLGLIERTGAFVTSTETVLFDALQVAGTDEFRALAPLVK